MNNKILNYSIETDLQIKFWDSEHILNKAKCIIAFSLDLDNANDNMRRYGYKYLWRKKMIDSFGEYVNTPSMIGIPFSDLSKPWWEQLTGSKEAVVTKHPETTFGSFGDTLTVSVEVQDLITEVTWESDETGQWEEVGKGLTYSATNSSTKFHRVRCKFRTYGRTVYSNEAWMVWFGFYATAVEITE